MGATCQLAPAEQDSLLALVRAGNSLASAARAIGKKPTAVQHTYRQLVRDGLLPKQNRPKWRTWTSKDRADLKRLLREGYGYDEIAVQLKRTRTSVVLQCRRHEGVGRISTAGTYSARDVAKLLGIGCAKTVVRWIEGDWLAARNAAPEGSTPLWRIQYDDLLSFLRHPDRWMAWHPERIANESLRGWADDVRAGQPQWLSVGEVARLYSVGHKAVGSWIQQSLLPSMRYGNHWIRESDLVGFVPPCERPRKRTNTLRSRHAPR